MSSVLFVEGKGIHALCFLGGRALARGRALRGRRSQSVEETDSTEWVLSQ